MSKDLKLFSVVLEEVGTWKRYTQRLDGFQQEIGICELKRTIEAIRENEERNREVLLKRLEVLEHRFHGELRDHYETEIFNELTEFPLDKSFREWEIREKIDAPYGHSALVLVALDKLVEAGAIESRGGGWYRRKL